MKRSPLKRGTGLSRGGPPKRKKRVKVRNKRRSEAAYIRCFRGEFPEVPPYDHGDFVRSKGCACFGPDCDGPVEAAHWRARGMGAAKGDWMDLVGLCRLHHDLLDKSLGGNVSAFRSVTGVYLPIVAYGYAVPVLRRHAGERSEVREMTAEDLEVELKRRLARAA